MRSDERIDQESNQVRLSEVARRITTTVSLSFKLVHKYKQIKELPSHVFPLKLPTHAQENEYSLFSQTPSFLQGSKSHGLGAKSIK